MAHSFLELLVSVLFSKNYSSLIQQTRKLQVLAFFKLIFNLENSNKSGRNMIVKVKALGTLGMIRSF